MADPKQVFPFNITDQHDSARQKIASARDYPSVATPAPVEFFSYFDFLRLMWTDVPDDPKLFPRVLTEIKFPQIATGLCLWVESLFTKSTDSGAPFASELYLYGGVETTENLLFAFNWYDYVRHVPTVTDATGVPYPSETDFNMGTLGETAITKFQNLPQPAPIWLFHAVNRLKFVVDWKPCSSSPWNVYGDDSSAQTQYGSESDGATFFEGVDRGLRLSRLLTAPSDYIVGQNHPSYGIRLHAFSI